MNTSKNYRVSGLGAVTVDDYDWYAFAAFRGRALRLWACRITAVRKTHYTHGQRP